MKRNNLKFHNVPEQQNETRSMLINTHVTIKHLQKEKLSIKCASMLIDDVFRLSSRTGHRPILVRFALCQDRDRILTAFRRKRKEGDPGFRIGEDLPRIARARSGLFMVLLFQQCIVEKKRAHFKFDKFIVENTIYEYDEQQKKPVRVDALGCGKGSKYKLAETCIKLCSLNIRGLVKLTNDIDFLNYVS
ncbi:hypothetical protein DPMN_073414 [Dreissena polymorpha]|uniref:Uncharacterized protein n=1 Tax=Dreissena polymorpha TaxID=45954 RepID=A0A9D4BZ10_DREPO|nr:hypothetical protein DPMN_073414 [Dreissena polymorpha]